MTHVHRFTDPEGTRIFSMTSRHLAFYGPGSDDQWVATDEALDLTDWR